MPRTPRPTVILLVAALAGVTVQRAPAQAVEDRISVLVHGSLTTATNLFLRPDAQDPNQREASEPYNSMLGGGIEVRIPVLRGEFFLSAAIGYSARVNSGQRPFAFPDTLRLVPVEEGVRVIPVELGLNARIPLGSESVRMSMGAGVGAYDLVRVIRVAGHDAPVDNVPVAVNIFVRVAFEVRLTQGLSLESSVKFLDPEARCENRFADRSISYGGSAGPLPTAVLPSRIGIDGMDLSLGLLVEVW